MSLPRAEALTHIEVEAIVRAVLQRLRNSDADNVARRSASVFPELLPTRSHVPTSGDAENASSVAVAGAVRLDQRLLALEHLRDHWNGLRVLQIPAACVVTPAVQDELRRRGVTLERFAEEAGNSTHTGSATTASLLVLAAPSQHAGLARQLTGSQTKLQRLDGDSLGPHLADLQQHLAGSDRYALCCTPNPFAAIAQIASQLATTTVQLPVLEDLPRAIEQAQPKLIVVDSTRWHAAAISQLVRNWTRSFTSS